jgi:hypothetical protein
MNETATMHLDTIASKAYESLKENNKVFKESKILKVKLQYERMVFLPPTPHYKYDYSMSEAEQKAAKKFFGSKKFSGISERISNKKR